MIKYLKNVTISFEYTSITGSIIKDVVQIVDVDSKSAERFVEKMYKDINIDIKIKTTKCSGGASLIVNPSTIINDNTSCILTALSESILNVQHQLSTMPIKSDDQEYYVKGCNTSYNNVLDMINVLRPTEQIDHPLDNEYRILDAKN